MYPGICRARYDFHDENEPTAGMPTRLRVDGHQKSEPVLETERQPADAHLRTAHRQRGTGSKRLFLAT